MTRSIPFGKPLLGEDEERAVLDVLRGGWLAHGPVSKEFEERFAAFVGVKHAVSVNSCTAALHLSLLALGIGPGDEVIVPALTHVATAHAVLHAGARPVFCDIDPATYAIDPADVRRRVTSKTKALHVVHFGGLACDMAEVMRTAETHGLAVVEDCAHGLGTFYDGKAAGTFGRSGCFSFYPVKHITTGEGGMLVTNDDAVAEQARTQRSFGIDTPAFYRQKPGVYDTFRLGFNYRMSDIAAAIGLAQLKNAETRIAQRIANAERLRALLEGIPGLRLPAVPKGRRHSFLFFQLRLTGRFGLSRDELLANLKRNGVGASIYYATPVPFMTFYRNMFKTQDGTFPEAEAAARETIALPVHPPLGDDDMGYIARVVRDAARPK